MDYFGGGASFLEKIRRSFRCIYLDPSERGADVPGRSTVVPRDTITRAIYDPRSQVRGHHSTTPWLVREGLLSERPSQGPVCTGYHESNLACGGYFKICIAKGRL